MLELKASRRRPDRGLLLRRQSRHGLVVCQAGASRYRRRLKIKFNEPATREGWAKLMKRVGVKGIHMAERDTQRSKNPKPLDYSSTPGRSKVSSRKACSPPNWAGAPMKRSCPPRQAPQGRLRCGDLYRAPRRRYPRAHLDADGRAPSSASWSPTTRRFQLPTISPCARERHLPANLPLCLSPLQRCGAVGARDFRQGRQAATRSAHARRE